MGYRAFFSYARADDKIANGLWGQLDRYRTPKALIGGDGKLGPIPPKLHPIFRDRTDLGAGHHLNAQLQQALEESECLVVLCTPTSAKSVWVNHEVETFLKLGREDRIFPVIGAGEPGSGDPETECLPPALRGRGILAADLREFKLPTGQMIGDGREGGRLKLIAGLLGVPLDALAQRERRRQRMLIGALGAAALVFAVVAAAAVLQTLVANEQRARAVAGETRAEQRALAEAQARADAERNAREREEQRLLADRNAEQASIQELAAQASARDASEQRDHARNALGRVFAERAREATDAGQFGLAARYAIFGWIYSPSNQALYRSALGRTLHNRLENYTLNIGPREINPSAGIRAATLSEGRVLLIAGSQAQIWDATRRRLLSWREIAADRSQYPSNVSDIVDGRVAFQTQIGFEVLDFETFNVVHRYDQSPHESIGPMALGPDHALLAVVQGNGARKSVRIHSGESFAQIASIELPGWLYPARATISADGRFLGIVHDGHAPQLGRRGRVLIYDLTRVSASPTELTEDEPIRTIGFSHDGNTIATGSHGRFATLWDRASGRRLRQLTGHQDAVVDVDFSPDDSHLVSASWDGSARVWNTEDGSLVGVLAGHSDYVFKARYGANGSDIVTSSWDGTLRIWNAHPSRELSGVAAQSAARSIQELGGRAPGSARRLNGNYIVTYETALGPRTIRFAAPSFRDSNNDLEVTDASGDRVLLLESDRRTVDAAMSNSGAFLGIVQVGGRTILRNMTSGEQTLLVRQPSGSCSSGPTYVHRRGIAFSEDDSFIAAISQADCGIGIWSVRNGRLVATIPGRWGGWDLEFSPDGERLAALDNAGLRVWDVGNAQEMFAVSAGESHQYNGKEGAFNSVGYSSDGSRLIITGFGVGGSPYTSIGLSVRDAENGEEIAELHPNASSTGAWFAANDAYVVFADDKIWDVRNATLSMRELVRKACRDLLIGDERGFSDAELAVDPLTREVLGREPLQARDLCNGVEGSAN